MLVGYGNTHQQISNILKIPVRTLERHFQQELASGKDIVDKTIQNRMYQRCIEGSDTMLIWWSKCRLRWAGPPEERKLGGLEGAPPVKIDVQGKVKGDYKPFTEAEIRKLGGLPPRKKK